MDYAAELAEKWAADSSTRTEEEAIEGAVREALDRAAEVARLEGQTCTAWAEGSCRRIEEVIRSLGAAK